MGNVYFWIMKKAKIIFPLVTVLCLASIFFCLGEGFRKEKYCGTIVDVLKEEVSTHRRKGRRYTNIERYALIKFDNGVTRAIELEPTSYFTAFNGKRVCLNLKYYSFVSYPYWLLFLSSIVIGVIALFGSLIALTDLA